MGKHEVLEEYNIIAQKLALIFCSYPIPPRLAAYAIHIVQIDPTIQRFS
jgi:hypothetical protein